MFRLIMGLTVLWVALCNNLESNRLSNTGVLTTRIHNKITLLQDSVLISFLFDPNEVKSVWNQFIESIDHLSARMEKK